MGFSRQEDWSGLPFPSPEELPNPGIELMSLASPALAGEFSTSRAIGEAPPTTLCPGRHKPRELWVWDGLESRHHVITCDTQQVT